LDGCTQTAEDARAVPAGARCICARARRICAREYAASVNAPRLTFDDGPGSDTEALLDVLERAGVSAAFFLVGERVAARPGTLERMVRCGHELGNHSWDHPDLRTLPLHEVRAQLERTNEAIEAACGVRPKVFRPPYGFTSVPIEELAESLGMRTQLWDVDTADWGRPGAEAVREAIASAAEGAVVLLHDGPRDREQTVAAVERWLSPGTSSPDPDR
jgi:peptidoglycan/xylan/chitin deacetylase (PgdA/CDA1 family)